MIETEIAKVERPGNGSATSFSFTFDIYEPRVGGPGTHDLYVVRVFADETEEVLTEGTGTNNYSVSVTEYPGPGSITFPASGASRLQTGEKLVIKRQLDLLQEIDLTNASTYFPDTLEQGLDKGIAIAIQQQEEIDRAIKVPIGSIKTSDELLDDILTAGSDAQTAATQAEAAQTAAEAAQTAAEAAAASISLPLPLASGGTGATSASAARDNLGLGELATLDLADLPSSGLEAVSAAKTADYTLTADDDLIYVDATSAARTITPAAAASNTRKIHIVQKTDSSANAVTITGIAALHTQGETVAFQSDGAAWSIIWRRIPGSLGTETWTDSEANCTTSVKLTRVGNMLIADGVSLASGAFSGSNFEVTIPTKYAPDSFYVRDNTNAVSVDLGNCNIADYGTGQYFGSVRLIEGNNIRLQVGRADSTYSQYAAITATVPMTWANNDRIVWRATWRVSGWEG